MAPDTPFAERGQTPAHPESSNASPAPSSIGVPTPSPPRAGEFQGNLRRMTNNLMEIFDQMSSKSAWSEVVGACVECGLGKGGMSASGTAGEPSG